MKFRLLSRIVATGLATVGAVCVAPAQIATAPAWASVKALGPGSLSLDATASAIDAAGNTYETGYFGASTSVGGVTLTSHGSFDGYLAKFSPVGLLLWMRQLGSTGYDLGMDVAVDAAGNAYVVGLFTGTIALGNGSTLQLDAGTGPNATKGFVVRYSPQGTPEWAQQSRSVSFASSAGMSGVGIDALGNVCVGGLMGGSIIIGSATASTSGNVSGTFLSRFSPASGALQQLVTGFEYAPITGNSASYSYPQLVVAPGNQLYLLSQFTENIVFNNTAFTNRGQADCFVARFSPQNAPEWAQHFGGPGYDRISNGAVDAAGNLYVTGNFTGPATFGSSSQAGLGGGDGYLVKCSSQGTVSWIQTVASNGDDNLSDVALDAFGNAYVSGSFTGTAQCGPATLSSAGLSDGLVASYNPLGQLRWVQQAGGPGNDIARYLGLDAHENIYVLGRFATGCAFGSQVLTAAASNESFVARLGSVGLASRANTGSSLGCYPNPATTRIHLAALPAGTRVQLFDVLGHLARETVVAPDASIPVLGLPAGLYTLHALDAQGKLRTGKVAVE